MSTFTPLDYSVNNTSLVIILILDSSGSFFVVINDQGSDFKYIMNTAKFVFMRWGLFQCFCSQALQWFNTTHSWSRVTSSRHFKKKKCCILHFPRCSSIAALFSLTSPDGKPCFFTNKHIPVCMQGNVRRCSRCYQAPPLLYNKTASPVSDWLSFNPRD